MLHFLGTFAFWAITLKSLLSISYLTQREVRNLSWFFTLRLKCYLKNYMLNYFCFNGICISWFSFSLKIYHIGMLLLLINHINKYNYKFYFLNLEWTLEKSWGDVFQRYVFIWFLSIRAFMSMSILYLLPFSR